MKTYLVHLNYASLLDGYHIMAMGVTTLYLEMVESRRGTRTKRGVCTCCKPTKILKLAKLNAVMCTVSQISQEALVMVVRIFHLDSSGEDAAVVGWIFNLVLQVGCLKSVVIIFKSMIISSKLSS